VAVASVGATLINRDAGGLFNDFYDYWGAARLLATAGNPYDIGSLASVLAPSGIQFQVGTGYSYPLLFAVVLVPLAALPPATAALVFTGLGVVALALAMAIMLPTVGRLSLAEVLILGAFAGLFTPVTGTIYFGQANLLVLPLLALAFRGRLRAPALALATAIKLYPVAGLVVLATRVRRDLGALMAGLALTAALVVLPNVVPRPLLDQPVAQRLGEPHRASFGYHQAAAPRPARDPCDAGPGRGAGARGPWCARHPAG
jgi:hypothetical protein